MKSILITNGCGLNEEKLAEMKSSGLTGVSFHIDSTQERPEFEGMENVSSERLNEVRLRYAHMVDRVGELTTNFGITADDNNFENIPEFVQWAANNSRVINSITFITYRGLPVGNGLEYFANGKKVDLKPGSLGYTISADEKEKISITSKDIYKTLKKHFPEYDANSYLGGTVDHTSFKWLLGNIILNSRSKMFGSYGKKSMEIVQTFYHLLFGTYIVHLRKRKIGKKVFILALFDKPARKALRKFIGYILVNPMRLFYKINILNIGIVQAPDLLPDGSIDMCESCPDMCVYEGKLVQSCRLDEVIQYGSLLRVVKKSLP